MPWAWPRPLLWPLLEPDRLTPSSPTLRMLAMLAPLVRATRSASWSNDWRRGCARDVLHKGE